MERPTGRRHVRAGSVHVTELIRRQAPQLVAGARGERPARVTDLPEFTVPPDAATTAPLTPAEPVAETASPQTARRVRAQWAKAAGLGFAVVALCASITAATLISRGRASTAATLSPTPALEITGQRALLPDELTAAVSAASLPTGEPAAPGRAAPPAAATTTPAGTTTSGRPAGVTSGSGTTAAAQGAAEPPSKTELVEEFYRRVEVSPGSAFDLLAGELLGTGLARFLHSWTSVTDVDVLDVTERGGDVLAVVRMGLPDGTHLLVRQLLHVANTAPHRIVGAEILSAQRN